MGASGEARENGEGGIETVLLRVNGERYALAIRAVREVVASPAITPLPTAPAAILGVFNLRGEIVPILDTASLLGLGQITTSAYAVVIDTPLGPVALSTDEVPRAAVLAERAGPSDTPGTLGAYAYAGEPAILIDVETLLVPARIGGWSA